MKQTIFVKPKQKRAENFRAAGVAKTADYAIGAANLFNFQGRSPFARRVRHIGALRDHAIEIAAGFFKPFLRLLEIGCCR